MRGGMTHRIAVPGQVRRIHWKFLWNIRGLAAQAMSGAKDPIRSSHSCWSGLSRKTPLALAAGLARARLCLAVCLLLLAVGSAPAQAAQDSRNVLVLYAAGRLLPANIEFDRSLRETLNTSPRPVQLFEEFLDVNRFPEQQQSQIFTNYLKEKYAAHRPDVIVAAGEEAMSYWLANRQSLFPDVPLVFAGVAEARLQTLGRLPPDVLGVPAAYDFVGTIRQALRLHPEAHHLVLVLGSSARDQVWEYLLRQAAPQLQGRVSVEFLIGLSADQLHSALRQLHADSLVFTPGFFKDAAGADYTPRDAARLVSEASPVPVYGAFPTQLGSGIVGGLMQGWDGIAEQAGSIALGLLAGKPGAQANVPVAVPSVMHVDWNVARRWGIDEQDFPPATVVHFREPGLLEQYGWIVAAGLLVMLLQAGLIGGLLFQRGRRRMAEQTMQTQNLELAHASRLAVAGQLTGSIAHEINQPLGAILSNAETADLLLQSSSPDRVELRQIMADIRRDDLRASQVIRRLRALLEKHELERAEESVNDILADVAGLLSAEAQRRKVVLEFQPLDQPLQLMADRVQIQQVLINLILNAMDAVAGNREEQRKVVVSAVLQGGRITLRVQDSGHGIAAEHVAKVFESFFTRKQEGMGLGLSIVKTIVEAHGGSICIEHSSPAGSVFCVELPVATRTEQEEV